MMYALKNSQTKKFIALDQSSGGYPYDVEDVSQAELWKTSIEALRYNGIMSYGHAYPAFTLCKVEFVITDLPTPGVSELQEYRK